MVKEVADVGELYVLQADNPTVILSFGEMTSLWWRWSVQRVSVNNLAINKDSVALHAVKMRQKIPIEASTWSNSSESRGYVYLVSGSTS